MSVAEAVRNALATAPDAVLVVAEAGRVGESVARLRATSAEMVLLLIDSAIPAIERAMLIAAIGPLAIERAPRGRIGAIDVAPGAATEDVAAAARFLSAARSTTGQVLTIA
jgi:hypothetical protein